MLTGHFKQSIIADEFWVLNAGSSPAAVEAEHVEEGELEVLLNGRDSLLLGVDASFLVVYYLGEGFSRLLNALKRTLALPGTHLSSRSCLFLQVFIVITPQNFEVSELIQLKCQWLVRNFLNLFIIGRSWINFELIISPKQLFLNGLGIDLR